MMKETLRNIVELFYQSPFKIFNINSIDGETMVKPFGNFISLGITTSLESLKNIRDYISKSDYGFEARLVEICSTKSDKYGDFLNTLLPTPEDSISKYPSEIPSNTRIMGKEETLKALREIQTQIQGGDFRLSSFRQKLSEVLERVGEDWDSKAVQIKDSTPSVFHRFVNYKRSDGSEYRIGIYVTKP